MNKRTSNNLVMLLLAVLTVIVVVFLLTLINVENPLNIIIGGLVGFTLYLVFIWKKRTPNKKKGLQPVSKAREEFYESRGLSDEDITFFRETMNNAKEQIHQVEENMNQVGKLRAIANRNNTLNLTKVLFKDIVNEPERLHEVDQFLYVHLPSLADLSSKYVQINQHQAKSKQTFDVLEKSARTIDELCQQISKDYVDFRSMDLDRLVDEVEIAKRRLKQEGSDIEEDEI